MYEPVPYDDRFREAFEQFPQSVKLTRMYLMPFVVGIVYCSVCHLKQFPPQHAGVDGGDFAISK